MEQNFSDLSVHDAVVESISVEWETNHCSVKIDTVDGIRLIQFFEVSKIVVPMEAPWGDSVCINKTKGDRVGLFEIQMQSGDVISVEAGRFTFE